jgi:hypothetical protein
MSGESPKDLEADVISVSEPLQNLVGALPNEIKPRSFAGFGAEPVGTNQNEMHGWNYDWSDRGSDPPPWSDWSNKTE